MFVDHVLMRFIELKDPSTEVVPNGRMRMMFNRLMFKCLKVSENIGVSSSKHHVHLDFPRRWHFCNFLSFH